jgi:hypothetical protein
VLKPVSEVMFMDESRSLEPSSDESATKLQADIEQCIVAIQQLREQMQLDQAEIGASRERTRAMLSRLRAA